MKPYVKTALEARGLDASSEWICEVCGKRDMVENFQVHHIVPKGMGGSRKLDGAENLLVCCRSCHTKEHENCHFARQIELQMHVQAILEAVNSSKTNEDCPQSTNTGAAGND